MLSRRVPSRLPPLTATGSVSTVASRRRAYRGPRVYGFRNPSSDYYEHVANKLPFGTRRWRDQMRRENRLGNPGG